MTEREVFLAAVEKDDPTERAAYLDQACGADATLRQRVEALLRSHERPGTFMDVPVVEQLAGDGGRSLDFLAPSQKPGSLGRLDHYEVLAVVGTGGMGVVLKAFDQKLHRVVAVKVLAAHLASSGTACKRFVREARAAAAITHDHVIDIHAVEDAGPVPYLVMEYIDGPSLDGKLRQMGPLEIKEILRIGLQIAAGLAAAHKQGLVHRDVKPANIMLENSVQRVKITDFGLARAVDDASLTQSGVVAGTPDYMSPEQANGDPVDHRSDLFSLGSVLYALCTGRSPFRASSTLAVLKRVSADTPRPPHEVNANVPAWLEAIIARLHAKNPADRFQTAAEVAELLGQHLAHLQQPDLIAPPSLPNRGLRIEDRGSRQRGRSFRSSIFNLRSSILCLLLLLVGSVAGYLIFRNLTGGPADARPIRVGILHSQTGTMGSSESPAIDATLLAIDEINQSGGLLGRPIEPIVVDGMSDWPTYAQEAERLITAERVCTIFGCWTSASRKAVTPVVEKYDHLLLYPMQYEGLEQSPYVVYTGAVPNQQVTPAVRWCFDHLGKRFFIVGSDYVWPRATSEVIRAVVAEWGGTIAGEAYVPMESVEVEAVVQKIRQSRPEVILEMVAGDSKGAYYRALRRAGISSDKVPSMSFSSPQPGLAARDIAGDYAAWNYFESIESPANRAFVARFRARFGPQRMLSDPLEASYLGVHLWAQAVRAAGSDDVAAIRRALSAQRFQAPEGEVRVDPETQHLWKTARVARLTSKGTAEVVWSSAEPVRPVPFPASRSRGQWERFLADLQQSWGGQWAAPPDAAAWERTVAALPAEQQVKAVAARLKDLNLGFDGEVTPTITADVVTGLRFSTDQVTDITPVRALTKLTVLDVSGKPGKLADLSPLKGMPLSQLHCKQTQVSDLSPLKGMPLTCLECGATNVSDLTPLKGMPLQRLFCQCPQVSDLSPLRGMHLNTLDVAGSGVTGLSPLQGMPLTNLDLSAATRLRDLSPVKGMPLEYLNLGSTSVTDLSALEDTRTLQKLILDSTPVTDLAALKRLPLQSLRIQHTQVSDLAPLKEMPLKQLWLDLPPAQNAEVLRSLKGLAQINAKPAAEFWKEYEK